jgi:3-hydroxyacyl-CoA dehydrogenase
MMSIQRIVVIGTGAMGSGAAALFSAAGFTTTLVGRTREKAQAAAKRAEHLAKRALTLELATFDKLAKLAGEADLVFESIAEDLAAKAAVFEELDLVRGPDTIVATGTSGLSIGRLCASRSDAFRSHFLGVHLFNPPTVIRGCELIAQRDTAPEVVAAVRATLERLQRVVVECADTPAFAGNRIGFRLLNEVAQLAEEHGVAYMDQLVGAHTGRALPPLATIDLVGWDVHKAIVDNLWFNTADEARELFALPAYMQRGIDAGHMGRKTRDKGGFFRIDGSVLDPRTFDYAPPAAGGPPPLVEQMKAALRTGAHPGALDALIRATCKEAMLLRRIVFGYISYALARVGEVVAKPRDVDRIMGFGFNWAPPSALVDAIGPARTAELLAANDFVVPTCIADAASSGQMLLDDPAIDSARFFAAAVGAAA